MMTWRGINSALSGKGTCDYFIGQLELREYLFAKVVPFLGPIAFLKLKWNVMFQHLP